MQSVNSTHDISLRADILAAKKWEKGPLSLRIIKSRCMSIPAAVRSKNQVCGCSILGIVGSNLAEDIDICLFVLDVCCAGSGLDDELITHS
jgi:hypothetical protein